MFIKQGTNIRLKLIINPKMLGNHPFAWFITFAFFYEVFKEHKQTFGTSVPYGRLVSTKVLTSLFSCQPKLLKE